MNGARRHPITSMQLIFILSGLQLSVSILSLPKDLADAAGTDGWMAIPLAFAINVVVCYVVVKIMEYHPNGTILDLLAQNFGVWVGKGYALLFSLYYLTFMYDSLDRGILITKAWLMPTTPSYMFMFLFLVPTYMISKHGPQVLGRYAEVVFFLSCWIPFIYLFTLKQAHWLYLLPMFKEGIVPILSALPALLYPSLGMVTIFILYPYLSNKKKAFRNMVLSNGLTMLAYLLITLACFIYFSPDEIKMFNEPIVSILKTIEFQFMERIEVPFISYYIIIYSLAWIPSTYIAAYCISWTFGSENVIRPLQILCFLLVVSSYFYIPTFNQSDRFGIWMGWYGIGMEYVFPFILLGYLMLRKRFRTENSL
ncbi:GerAB/ArcD/ProY family transporter [Paenibacillus sp. FJAT-27812]|uniref:GerAB/ArcD/ProY family transporter n=1 Tax=Paenibacillus sp. FJAT-27812 TaxID=1684143 RepID=UPI0006A7DBB1|nr:endospore germination permease [Paenibacillus sp. FJAT-27812]